MADKKTFESSLHDIVYSIDMGTGLKIIRVFLYILLLLLVVLVYTATQFRGLKTEESMDYAQLGRNFSLQNGLQTKYVRPLSMWKVSSLNPDEKAMVKEHPDLFHPPAYPMVLSAGFGMFEAFGVDLFAIEKETQNVSIPAEKWVILPINHLFSILTGCVVFLFGKRLFSREIAFLGMTIYFLSDLVWRDSISGLNLSMAIFFTVAAFYSMVVAMLNRRDAKSTVKWMVPFALSIVFSAIAFLTRYIAIAVVPGICLFAWLMGRGLRGGAGRMVAVYILFFLLLVSPWLVRNYRVCGNPMGMAGHTALVDSNKYPDNSLVRDLHPAFEASQATTILKAKWNTSFSERFPSAIPAIGGGFLAAFFLVTFFYHFIRPQVNYLRWGVALSMVSMAVIAGYFSESSVAMLHAFWPFIILYALAFFNILLDRLDLDVRLYETGLKIVFVVIGAGFALLLRLLPPNETVPYPPYYAPYISMVSGWLNPSEVMCSDMPWATAWYGDRASVLLPKDVEQFFEINDMKQVIAGLYITPVTKHKPFVPLMEGADKSWFLLVNGQAPGDFPLRQGTMIHEQDQIFYSDRNRWSSDIRTGQ